MATPTVLKPIYDRLAMLPSAEADAALAASLIGRGWNAIEGRWSDPDELSFEFRRADGTHAYFTGDEMKASTWWYWLPEEKVTTIEAALFPLPPTEPRVRYVARSDRRGKLIRGSRLSGYFEGEGACDSAYRERELLRPQWPDAAVFHADSVEDAERLLSPDANEDEGMRSYWARGAVERAQRLDALIHQLAPAVLGVRDVPIQAAQEVAHG